MKVIAMTEVPKKSDAEKELSFLMNAVSTDQSRPQMSMIYYNGDGELAATDSKRLHVVKYSHGIRVLINALGLSELSKCHLLYDKKGGVLKLLDSAECGNFPNYQRVIPEDNQIEEFKFLINFNDKKKFESNATTISAESGARINLSYLADCIGYTWYAYAHKDKALAKERAIVLKDDTKEPKLMAIIMPMQLD